MQMSAAAIYKIIQTKLASVSLFVKATALKQQISKFYPNIISTETSYHIYISVRFDRIMGFGV